MARTKNPNTFWRLVWKRFRKSKAGLVGLALTLVFILLGFFAPIIASENPVVCSFDGKFYAPAIKDLLHANLPFSNKVLPHSAPFDQAGFSIHDQFDEERGDWAVWTPIPYGPLRTSENGYEPMSGEHWLGTDQVGRDLAARMVHGARVSMLVGFVSVGISTVIGLILGALAGYFGGWVDSVISRIIEIVLCFPVFFLILTVLAIAERPSIWIVMVVIGVVRWTGPARYVRGEFIKLRDSEYALAAVALGASPLRVIFRHILPNSLAPVFVTVTFGIAAAILLEAGLSYLGIGVQPPAPSWGNILRKGYEEMGHYPIMIWPPAIMIFLGVMSYNLVGDALRDAIDPRLRQD